MKKNDYSQVWKNFIHWGGWRAFATLWVKCFALPFPLIVVLFIISGAGLIWVFLRHFEQHPAAYFLYALSAYSVTALCVRLPGAVRSTKQWLHDHPKIESLLKNEDLKFKLELYFQQMINFAYGIFKIISGVVIGSAWIGCDGIYNLAQAMIQLFQILRRRKSGTLLRQWRSYRVCGVLILLMHFSLIGIVFQMVNWNRSEEQGQIMVIATAAFAFYKFITSFIDIAKDRRHSHPVDSSVRMLELSQAIFAIFSLQASMFHTFGTGERWEHWLNLGTGCTVCLLTVCMGIYMIRRGNREIKKWKENTNGEQSIL